MTRIAPIFILAIAQSLLAGPLQQREKFYDPNPVIRGLFGEYFAISGNDAIIRGNGRIHIFDLRTAALVRTIDPIAPARSDTEPNHAVFASGDLIFAAQAILLPDGTYRLGQKVYSKSTGEFLSDFNGPIPDPDIEVSGAIFADKDSIVAHRTASFSDPLQSAGATHFYDLDTLELVKAIRPQYHYRFERVFGNSVAVHNGIALIAGYQRDFIEGSRGPVVFVVDVESEEVLHVLSEPSLSRDPQFGRSLALNDRFAFIYGRAAQPGGFTYGAFFVFDLSTGRKVAELTPQRQSEIGRNSTGFFPAIALTDTHVILSSDDELRTGAAYVYRIQNDGFILRNIHYPQDQSQRGTAFGIQLAIFGPTAVIAAPGEDIIDGASDTERGEFLNHGAVYLFDLESCDGDANADGKVDVVDISFILMRMDDDEAPRDRPGDVFMDGRVDLNDILYTFWRLGVPCKTNNDNWVSPAD